MPSDDDGNDGSSTARPTSTTKTPNPPPQEDRGEASSVLLIFCVGAVIVLMGLPLGAVALQKPLLADGLFSDYCAADDTARPCNRQDVLIAQAFQIVIIATVASAPAGLLTDRLGPLPTMCGGAVVAAVGCGILGVAMSRGWAFFAGMFLWMIGGIAMYSSVTGGVVPLATRMNVVQRNRWSAILSSCVDVGYACAYPVSLLISWRVLPLWAWFVAIGGSFVVILVPGTLVLVSPLMANRPSSAARDSSASTVSFGAELCGMLRMLKNKDVWVCVFQFAVSTVLARSCTAASGQVATFFDLPSDTTLYVPVLMGGMGIVFTLLSFTPVAENVAVMSTLRIGTLIAGTLALTLRPLASPVAFWIGLSLIFFYRVAALVSAVQCSGWIGVGGNEGKTIGVALLVAAAIGAVMAQPFTYVVGRSGNVFAIAVGSCAACCLVVEVLATLLAKKLRRKLTADTTAASVIDNDERAPLLVHAHDAGNDGDPSDDTAHRASGGGNAKGCDSEQRVLNS